MGGAKNLKLGATWGKGLGTAVNIFCVGQMLTLFNCCMRQKEIAGSTIQGQSLWSVDQGGGGEFSLKLKHLTYGILCSMKSANLPVL